MVNKNYKHLLEGNLSIEDLINHPEWKDAITSEVFVYQLLNKTSFSDFGSLPQEILNKPAIILSALEKFYLSQKVIPGNFSQDVSFCMYCCNLDPKYAKLFGSLIENEESVGLWYINEFKNIAIAQFLPEKYISEERFARLLIKNNIKNYPHLSLSLRNDVELYKSLTLSQKNKVYKYVGEKISSNWEFSVEVITNEPTCYQYAHVNLQKNPDFYLDVMENLSSKSSVKTLLMSAPTYIQDNEHCIWQTLLVDPESLSFASQRLLNSTSFAQQVITSMNSQQISQSFEHWGLHVKNSGVTLEELLPKIIEANCLELLGPDLKENFGFMLKAILIDSKQALECCAPTLLCNSQFIISAYHAIDEKNRHKDRYDESSEQSGVFNYIPSKATDDADFITSLYKEFKDIFVPIIYPKIKNEDTILIHYLNASSQKENGLVEALEKMLLKDELQKELSNEHSTKKKPKI